MGSPKIITLPYIAPMLENENVGDVFPTGGVNI
jgi:hypothetical protein